jgi:hypothetical protein
MADALRSRPGVLRLLVGFVNASAIFLTGERPG